MKPKRNGNGKAQPRARWPRRRVHGLYITAIAALGVALAAVITLGNREAGPSPEQIAGATGTLTAPLAFHEFGQVPMRDGKVAYRFQVRNDGGTPALVDQIYTSCMCTEASLLVGKYRAGPFGMQGHGFTPHVNRIIEPGQEAVVEAVFDPGAHGPAGIGRNDRDVSVVMGGRRVLELKFTAYVTP